jgi:hypothetical protein
MPVPKNDDEDFATWLDLPEIRSIIDRASTVAPSTLPNPPSGITINYKCNVYNNCNNGHK